MARNGPPNSQRQQRPDPPGDRGAPGRMGRVYKPGPDGKPVAVTLRLGISDGKQTEVLEGLSDGDQVIVGGGEAGGARPGGPRRGPF